MSKDQKLNGQVLFAVRYVSRDMPTLVKSTGLFTSTQPLFSRGSDRPTESVAPPKRSDGGLVDLLRDYTRISGYAAIGVDASRDVLYLPDARFSHYLENDSASTMKLVRRRGKSDLFATHSLDIRELELEIEKFKHASRYGYAVRNAIFVGLVSTFDELLAEIIRTALREKPGLLSSFEKTVSYQEVVSASDFKAFQKQLIDTTVSDLMKKSRLDQISWVEKHVSDIRLKEALESYSTFIEAAERRNIFVHNDGYPSSEYYSRISASTGVRPSCDPDERLSTSGDYFLNASDALLEAYVLISQSAIRKLVRRPSADEAEKIDDLFAQAAFYQIENGRYESASRISRMLLSGKFKISDFVTKMATVNYSISELKCGRVESGRKILNNADWSSAKDEFNICVSAIKGDVDSVIGYIPKLVGSDLVNPQAYFMWPAFDGIRDDPRFWSTLVSVYGEQIKQAGDISEKLEVREVEGA